MKVAQIIRGLLISIMVCSSMLWIASKIRSITISTPTVGISFMAGRCEAGVLIEGRRPTYSAGVSFPAYGWRWDPMLKMTQQYLIIGIPLWWPIVAAGVVLCFDLHYTRRSAKERRCIACGYPTQGLPDIICPECGKAAGSLTIASRGAPPADSR